MTEEKMFDKEIKQKIKENDEIIECEKGEMKFRGMFQKFIETFEDARAAKKAEKDAKKKPEGVEKFME
jgi:hypothetical protein